QNESTEKKILFAVSWEISKKESLLYIIYPLFLIKDFKMFLNYRVHFHKLFYRFPVSGLIYSIVM
ncbi:MAG: hypothetical protein Q8M94_20385, partial [Ignavibacteria bacterium]|nr:hypothetical protein [Ignavibacteria bacterium]